MPFLQIRKIVSATVLLGFLWFSSVIFVQLLPVFLKTMGSDIVIDTSVINSITEIGRSVGNFIAPIFRLSLIALILLSVADHIGFKLPTFLSEISFNNINDVGNVQAIIALIVVFSLCICAIGGVGDIGVLKDLALVVVGFYFGHAQKLLKKRVLETDNMPPS